MAPAKKAAAKKATAKKAAAAPRSSAAAQDATPSAGRRERTPEELEQAVRVAEAAGQRAVVELERGAELPEDLQKALEKRIEINLAATGGHPAVSMAGSDPAVVKLESKYRRKSSESDDDSATS